MRGEFLIASVLACATIVTGGYAILKQGSQITDHSVSSSPPAAASSAAQGELPSRTAARTANPASVPPVPSPPRPQASSQYSEANPPGPRQIYLCRNYAGGRFYSNLACSQQNALMERIVPGKPSLTFDDQVRMAEQAEAQRIASAQAQGRLEMQYRQSAVSSHDQCERLYERVKHLDELARQPNSPPYQDWLRAERRKTTDQIFSIGC